MPIWLLRGRRWNGWDWSATVETKDDGPIETNADLVIAAIRARAQSGRRLIIVSASKSGPEVALALTKLGPAETRHVAAWINTVGALQGTPMADEHLAPELDYVCNIGPCRHGKHKD